MEAKDLVFYNEGKKAGIRDMVEWINKNELTDFFPLWALDEWQAKLKEWGIE